METHHIVLLQEHWLFQFQLNLLGEINPDIKFVGKAVDMNDNIQPSHVPRGFGGVAVLWKKECDHIIKNIDDGNERIQGIELLDNLEKPLLILSVYLPTKGCHDLDTFKDCVDQLHVIVQKYNQTHDILIGGDINEDLSKNQTDNRSRYLYKFITECHLEFTTEGNTFTNSIGRECSEIDYFLYNKNSRRNFSKKVILNKIETNTSDHYPISITLDINLNERKSYEAKNQNRRVNWNKIDTEQYAELISNAIVDKGLNARGNENLTITNIDQTIFEINKIIKETTDICIPDKKAKKKKGQLQIWNSNISEAYKKMKSANIDWYEAGKPKKDHPTITKRKEGKQLFRRVYRTELAMKDLCLKEKILNTKTKDTKTFHMLLNLQRKSTRGCIQDLYINNEFLSGEENVMEGFKTHFEALAQPIHEETFNYDKDKDIEQEVEIILQLVKSVDIDPPSRCEVQKAVNAMNRGKAADKYELTIESIQFGGDSLLGMIHDIIILIFKEGLIPEILKVGLLSPVFKNKGSIFDVKNYRGITILPVICKIIETILKFRIQPQTDKVQCSLQRGFTKKTAPLNAAFILEELRREALDLGLMLIIIFLDAKSAFDVVVHQNLIRRLYHLGINDKHLSLIHDLHKNAVSAIKFNGRISENFPINQGVRQGGILSADLYKIYIDPLLHQIQKSNFGMKIGHIHCGATACADDITLNSTNFEDAQIMLNLAYDFSCKEHYKLQPQKSVVIQMNSKSKDNKLSTDLKMKDKILPKVQKATHLGIQRSDTDKDTINNTVNENIKKARRTAYSLMSAGFHGNNGLDASTCIHILKIYIIPTLLYGLEIIIPDKRNMEKLEQYLKKTTKQILSLPQNVPETVPYILSGLIPIEGQIHIKILVFMYSICLLPDNSTEKQIAQRQLMVKDNNSNSWLIAVKKIIWKYDLPNIYLLLEKPYSKYQWKKLVYQEVHKFWKHHIVETSKLYKNLDFLNIEIYTPGKQHPLIYISTSSLKDFTRIPIKLKLVSGAYIFQLNRSKFKNNQCDPVCQLCGMEDEDISHFLLRCNILESIRQNAYSELAYEFVKLTNQQFCNLSDKEKISIILDSSTLLSKNNNSSRFNITIQKLKCLEYQCRRLVYNLHSARYKMLQNIKGRRQ